MVDFRRFGLNFDDLFLAFLTIFWRGNVFICKSLVLKVAIMSNLGQNWVKYLGFLDSFEGSSFAKSEIFKLKN